jgi:hypothetical protein
MKIPRSIVQIHGRKRMRYVGDVFHVSTAQRSRQRTKTIHFKTFNLIILKEEKGKKVLK